MIAWEYFLTDDNKIKGWQQWPKHKRPELSANQEPPDKMMQFAPHKDVDRAILTNDGTNFILQPDGSISEVDHIDNAAEIFEKKYTADEKIRILMAGVQDKTDPEFVQLVNDMQAAQVALVKK